MEIKSNCNISRLMQDLKNKLKFVQLQSSMLAYTKIGAPKNQFLSFASFSESDSNETKWNEDSLKIKDWLFALSFCLLFEFELQFLPFLEFAFEQSLLCGLSKPSVGSFWSSENCITKFIDCFVYHRFQFIIKCNITHKISFSQAIFHLIVISVCSFFNF